MDNITFTTPPFVYSRRIIYTPSPFARSSLIHLQETGTLQATHPHKNERSGLRTPRVYLRSRLICAKWRK